MKKILFVLLFFSLYSFALEGIEAKRENVLYVQQLIQREEAIAKALEDFILKEYALPHSLPTLKYTNYLDKSFSLINKFGSILEYKDKYKLQLKYAITKDTTNKEYIKLLYNRDLYRDRTSVHYDKTNPDASYVEIKLKSPQAQNIYEFFKLNRYEQLVKCDNRGSKYCIEGENIRYQQIVYSNHLLWIEYAKEDYKNSNVVVGTRATLGDIDKTPAEIIYILQTDVDLKKKMKDIKIGAYVFVQNNEEKTKVVKYMKTGKNQYLKVE